MWKRERSEPVDLEQVMTEPPGPVASGTRPVAPPSAPVIEIPAERSPAPTSLHAAAGKGSTLGATLRFKGDLVADEDLVIQGQVEGSILHTRSLTIGAQGRVLGDIRARRIVVEGSVDGNLYALESVSLRAGAVVRGDVFAAAIGVDNGARLTGRIDMDNAPTVPTIKVPASGSTEPASRDLSAPEADAVLTGS
jgi:cytoskeletal protein CcmA (bactofilin family)